MGRNRKMGLDYFPFDIDTFQDIKIRKLIKYQGGKAITIYALLLCFIYKDGYYMRWDKELPFIISEQTGFEEAYISEVIKSCLTLGLFSKELFDTEQVLTSKGIQSRYRDICKQIKRKCDFSEYSLISSEENDISSEEIPVSSEEKPINSANSTQKKIKGKENIAIAFPSNEAKASFPSNEEKAAAICACEEVEVSGNPGNGGLGGSSETLAAEAAPEEETTTPGASQPDKIPYQEIVDMFNSICTGYPRVVKLSDSRKNKIRIRVEEMGGFARAKPMIQTIFEKMQASKFLRGDGKSGWKAYFDWVFVNDKNWVKILEGNYDNKISDNEPNTGATGTMGAIPYARQAAGDKAASREAVGQFARAVLEQYKSKTGD